MVDIIKYGIGTKVNMFVPQSDKLPVLFDNKLGLIYKIQLLDPRIVHYFPIGPKPLPFAQEDNVKA